MRADEIAIMQAEARRIGAELLLPTPRGILNAETGRFAHACPDLDQEFESTDPRCA